MLDCPFACVWHRLLGITKMTVTEQDIAAVLRRLAKDRRPDKTFCPSEAARLLSDDWRPLMADVRRVAGKIGLRATQKGRVVHPVTARGPIRLAHKPD